jgi:hypothetical protein
MSGGTSVSHLIKRLRDLGRQDLLDAVEGGRISAYAAAEWAGLLTRRPIEGTGSTNRARRRQRQLEALTAGDPSVSEQQQELWLGPGPAGSLFRDREGLRAAWERARDQVMQWWGSHGRRPAAWWEFEAGDLKYPGRDLERSILWRAGRLSEAERAELEQRWRAEFDKASAHNFAISRPWPDAPLTGDTAKRAHLAWADVPPELAEMWTAERASA